MFPNEIAGLTGNYYQKPEQYNKGPSTPIVNKTEMRTAKPK